MRTLSVTPFPDHPTVGCPEDVGSLVRAVRTAAGMTLEETALAVQVAKQTLQNLEKGTGTVSLSLNGDNGWVMVGDRIWRSQDRLRNWAPS